MVQKKEVKNYTKTGIIAAAVIAVAVLGAWGVSALNRGGASVSDAMAVVSSDAASAANMRIAVIRMDAIQTTADVLKDLRSQKESYESKLRDELTKKQKELEEEKAEIEKSQDVLSRDALQRRVVDYQNRVTKLQRELTERAQSVEMSFQKALNEIQEKHLDPVIEGIIAKKQLSLVIDGRMARTGAGVANLDITDEVIKALDENYLNNSYECKVCSDTGYISKDNGIIEMCKCRKNIYAQKKFKLKSIISISILFFLLFTLIPSYGLGEFFFSIGLTFFSLACYVIIYKLLSDKLSFLLGDYYIPDYAPLLDLPEKGSTLDLHKLNLTERQIACIHYTIDSTYNYKKIAEELITSESTVKKNMQDLKIKKIQSKN